jgi:hypothetical protein
MLLVILDICNYAKVLVGRLSWGISFHTYGWMALIMKDWLEVTLSPLVSSRHGVPQRMDSGIIYGRKGWLVSSVSYSDSIKRLGTMAILHTDLHCLVCVRVVLIPRILRALIPVLALPSA